MTKPKNTENIHAADGLDVAELAGDIAAESSVEIVADMAMAGIEIAGTVAGAAIEGLGALDIGI